MVHPFFIFTFLLGYSPRYFSVRIKRQIHFPLQGNKTNQDGCPERLPCYISTLGACVEAEYDGKCPEVGYRDVLEEVETPMELKKLNLFPANPFPGSIPTDTVLHWIGTPACPACDRPSCQCLDNFNSLINLYPDTYLGMPVPDKLPLCDQLSGQPWCYVHRHSECCGDNRPTDKYPHVDQSFQACKQPQLLAQGRCKKPCRCSPNDAFGKECTTTYQGDYWCYVDPEACCELKVQSKENTNLYWSTEPCSGSSSQVNLDDFENRILENGYVICDTDTDCFSVAAKNECRGDRAYCKKNSLFIESEFEEKVKDRGICVAEDHNTCNRRRQYCINPCHTSTCFSARVVRPGMGAAGGTMPLSASSLAGVGVSSLTGHLIDTGGCPPRLPCKCGVGRKKCCQPLWGGRNRGLFCPRNYIL